MIYNQSRHRRKMAEGGDAASLTSTVEDRLSGEMPEGASIAPEKIADQDLTDAEVSYTGLDAQAPSVTAEKADDPTLVPAPATPEKDEYSYEASTAADQITNATAAQLERSDISPEVTIEAPQGTLSSEAIAEAAQGKVQQEQLVSFQLGELYSSIEEGKPLPPWAAGPVRVASSIMAQRGLGASSMAAAAVSQAVLEAGLPIAAADAAEYSKINIANLNNRQAAVLQNAAAMAQMDMANLDARMKAAITNAQSFLAIDLQNLNNEQATETLNYQGMLQAVFTDTAAENAAAQFNAKSQQQVDEFFAELGVQVDNANANRVAAMGQFNVDQANSIAQFNASLEDARERFDTSMQTQIDQSNAQWRRDIAKADTAVLNEAQRQNALNVLQITQSALSALWQRYRDESAWVMQSTENAASRAHQLAMLEFEKNANVDMFGLESEYETAASVGSAALASILGFLSD